MNAENEIPNLMRAIEDVAVSDEAGELMSFATQDMLHDLMEDSRRLENDNRRLKELNPPQSAAYDAHLVTTLRGILKRAQTVAKV